jgi:hypothetical protein
MGCTLFPKHFPANVLDSPKSPVVCCSSTRGGIWSCVCQVLQIRALLDRAMSGHPAGATRRRHPLRRNGAQRARARRQARRSFPCARAPFWHLRLRRAARRDDYILLVSSELVFVFLTLRVSSTPSCVLSGIPCLDSGSPQSSSRAFPRRVPAPAADRLPDSGRFAPPACAA